MPFCQEMRTTRNAGGAATALLSPGRSFRADSDRGTVRIAEGDGSTITSGRGAAPPHDAPGPGSGSGSLFPEIPGVRHSGLPRCSLLA